MGEVADHKGRHGKKIASFSNENQEEDLENEEDTDVDPGEMEEEEAQGFGWPPVGEFPAVAASVTRRLVLNIMKGTSTGIDVYLVTTPNVNDDNMYDVKIHLPSFTYTTPHQRDRYFDFSCIDPGIVEVSSPSFLVCANGSDPLWIEDASYWTRKYEADAWETVEDWSATLGTVAQIPNNDGKKCILYGGTGLGKFWMEYTNTVPVRPADTPNCKLHSWSVPSAALQLRCSPLASLLGALLFALL